MKKNRSSRLIVIFFLFLIINLSCTRVTYRPRLYLGPADTRWVKKTLEKMTLEEKVGQMVACRYSGYFNNMDSEYLEELESLIVTHKIGGLIIFGGNVYETAYLTNSLQEMAKLPLLIASDFERGAGNQIDGATEFPPLMAVGAVGSEESAYLMGKITAVEGRAMGIHMTYAPVVDVNINPENPIISTRSLGEDPEHVSRFAKAFIRGCQDNGLIATAKHFPGHGDTDLDSHSLLPTIRVSRERLEKVELYPFKRAIQAGVQAIMIAHLHLPSLDPTPDVPATLSPKIVTELLREKLGFEGIIVTDSMGMGGITTLYEPEEAALRAVKAGVDILLLPPEPERVIEALIQAVSSGQISKKRIDSSVKRILGAKSRLGLHKNRIVDVDNLNKVIASKEHLQHAFDMFKDSITLVKNEGGILPLPETCEKLAVLSLSSDLGDYFAGKTLIREIEKKCPEVTSFYAERSTGNEFIQEGFEKAKEADYVVFALFSRLSAWKGSVDLEPRHIQLVKDITERCSSVVVVSFGSPYFLRHFPEVDCYLCAYRSTPQAQKAVVKALFGEIDIKGKLPVSFPGLYPLGHGLFLPKKSN